MPTSHLAVRAGMLQSVYVARQPEQTVAGATVALRINDDRRDSGGSLWVKPALRKQTDAYITLNGSTKRGQGS